MKFILAIRDLDASELMIFENLINNEKRRKNGYIDWSDHVDCNEII